MTLISILVGTLVAGMGSVWLAALLAYALLSRFTQHLLSLAAGALLATAFTRLLPEAFELSVEAGVSAQALFAALLVGLVFFFLLDKAELWHHGHEHGHDHAHSDAHDHTHEHAHHTHDAHHHHHDRSHHSGGWAVLLGDSVQTNWLTDYAPTLLLYATLLEAAPMLKNDERVPVWQQMYDRSASTLNGQDLLKVVDRASQRTEA